jgi:hypothetical protein
MSEHTASAGDGPRRRTIDDSEAAALMAERALVEIRYLAWRSISNGKLASIDQLGRIHFLADLAHNLPGIAHRAAGRRSSRDAMRWVWSTAGQAGQTWMLDTIRDADCVWTPPPPSPPRSTRPASLSLWQRIRTIAGPWPVRTPIGRQPLPGAARAVKALNTPEIVALHEEREQQRLGLGSDADALRAHLDPDGTHYLVPDPASYYWPDAAIRWWQCRELLRMEDGAQVTSFLAVLPQRFGALPSTLPRREQRRLLYVIRNTQYDLELWGRNHGVGRRV